MKNLKPVDDDPQSSYKELVDHKEEPHRSTLKALRRRVFCAYRYYYKHKPELHRIPHFHQKLRSDEREALLHCYKGAAYEDNPKNPLRRLYKKIRELASTCPYCTIIPTQTLDHYLPKSSHPEFAVLPINLIPSCQNCNRPRDFRDASGERALIHPYFDHVPSERLLVAKVRVLGGVPEVDFDVDLSRCTNLPCGRLYERHIALLELKPRYRKWAMEPSGLPAIRAQLRSFARVVSGRIPPAALRQSMHDLLAEQAAEEEGQVGPNDFRVALKLGAAASNDFLDHCL